MKKFRVTEVFYSIQGEGQFVGVPSVFLRVFGCNFKCRGFGMSNGDASTEYLNINPKDYNTFEDLPLVTTGCDSYASWDPRFKHFTTDIDTDALVELLLKHKADPYKSDGLYTPLENILQDKDKEHIINYLDLFLKYNVEFNKEPVLQYVIDRYDVLDDELLDIIPYLIEKKADLNKQDDDGETPLKTLCKLYSCKI